ncbi:hypothetical protein J5N97_030172 [Dioscorea zingiberensis]|uniref:DUF674 domain-containing protein n=1 Tax=Dioscorea zingiberensis TaxID=325984 RepID=A0A9D5H401_9LILI|nr:hypothetical protein J5N97_030172 [Dioscorea zingiberensis]
MVGSIGSIYSSLESLDLTYMKPNRDKKTLLNPKGGQNSQDHNFLLPAAPSPPKHNRYFRCHPSGEYSSSYGSCSMYFTDAYGGSCPCCKRQMMTEMKRVDYGELLAISNKEVVGGEQEGASYVKGVITYTVMDDLSVMPMSTISTISMLNKFGVKNVNLLKEENVSLGLDKALKLLKASFESKTVLTDVFLN